MTTAVHAQPLVFHFNLAIPEADGTRYLAPDAYWVLPVPSTDVRVEVQALDEQGQLVVVDGLEAQIWSLTRSSVLHSYRASGAHSVMACASWKHVSGREAVTAGVRVSQHTSAPRVDRVHVTLRAVGQRYAPPTNWLADRARLVPGAAKTGWAAFMDALQHTGQEAN